MSLLPRILLVSHRGRQCGVQQFGRRLFQVQSRHGGVDWRYAECGSIEEFLAECAAVGATAVVVNHHEATSPWAEDPRVRECGIPCFAVVHEGHQLFGHRIARLPFDRLLYADPTHVPRSPLVIPLPRFIPAPRPPQPEPEIFTIGSFGFPTPGKGMEHLCGLVNAQFDRACIRINLAPHDSCVSTADSFVREIVEKCHASITSRGIDLQITHRFFTEDSLLDFLSENTINAFLYESEMDGARGISSCTDYALAAGRPLAVSNSGMFRHLHGIMPTISAERRGLRDIAALGIKPLAHHIALYEPAAAAKTWNEAILKALKEISIARDVPDGRGFNKIITARSVRRPAADLPEGERGEAPDRSSTSDCLTQLFVVDALERLSTAYFEPRILIISTEDGPLGPALQERGYAFDRIVTEGLISGQILPGHSGLAAFDIIGCATSMNDPDDLFSVAQAAASRLLPGGVAIFGVTCQSPASHAVNTERSWPEYMREFTADLPDCLLIDTAVWEDGGADGAPAVGGGPFAWTFRKMDAQTLRNCLTPTRQHTADFLLPAEGKLQDLGAIRRIGFTQGRSRVEGRTRLLHLNAGESGFLCFGPYLPLRSGRYTCYFLLRMDTADLPDDMPIARIDLVLDQKEDGTQMVITAGDLRPGVQQIIAFDFVVQRATAGFECRVFSLGAAVLNLAATFAMKTHAPLVAVQEISAATY